MNENINFENVDVAFRVYKINFPDDNISFKIGLFDDAPFYDRYGREFPFSLHMSIRADSDNDIDYIVINRYKVVFANIDRISENNEFNYFIKNEFDDSLKYVNNGYNDGYYPNDIFMAWGLTNVGNAHNSSVYASPPYGNSGYEKTRFGLRPFAHFFYAKKTVISSRNVRLNIG